MIITNDDKKERVHIGYDFRGNEYFCSTCGDKLSIKKDNIKFHHYSHFETNQPQYML